MILDVHSGSRVKNELKGFKPGGQAGGSCSCPVRGLSLQPGEHSGFEGRGVEVAAREADSPGSDGRPVKGLLMGTTGSHIRDCRAQGVPELSWYVLLVSLESKPSLNVSSAKEGLICPYFHIFGTPGVLSSQLWSE